MNTTNTTKNKVVAPVVIRVENECIKITEKTLRKFCTSYFSYYGLPDTTVDCNNSYQGKQQKKFTISNKHGIFHLGTAKQAIRSLMHDADNEVVVFELVLLNRDDSVNTVQLSNRLVA